MEPSDGGDVVRASTPTPASCPTACVARRTAPLGGDRLLVTCSVCRAPSDHSPADVLATLGCPESRLLSTETTCGILTAGLWCAVAMWEPLVAKHAGVHCTLVVPVPNLVPKQDNQRRTLLDLRRSRLQRRTALWNAPKSEGRPPVPTEAFARQLRGLHSTAGRRMAAPSAASLLCATETGTGLPKWNHEQGNDVDALSVVHMEAFTKTSGEGEMASLLSTVCGPDGPGFCALPDDDANRLFCNEQRLARASGRASLLHKVRQQFAHDERALMDHLLPAVGTADPLFVTDEANDTMVQGRQDDHLPTAAPRTPLLALTRPGLGTERVPGATAMFCAVFNSTAKGPQSRQIHDFAATTARLHMDLTADCGLPDGFVQAVHQLQAASQDKIWAAQPTVERQSLPDLPPPSLVITRPVSLASGSGDCGPPGGGGDGEARSGPHEGSPGSEGSVSVPPDVGPPPDNVSASGPAQAQGGAALLAFVRQGPAHAKIPEPKPPETRQKRKARLMDGHESEDLSAVGLEARPTGRRQRPPPQSGPDASAGDTGADHDARRRLRPRPQARPGDSSAACRQRGPAYASVMSGALGPVLRNVVVTREWFDLMSTGEKCVEYRKRTRYWLKRLTDARGRLRRFRFVQICCGYARKRPQFVASCGPLRWVARGAQHTFSTGSTLVLDHRRGYIGIGLGQIVHRR